MVFQGAAPADMHATGQDQPDLDEEAVHLLEDGVSRGAASAQELEAGCNNLILTSEGVLLGRFLLLSMQCLHMGLQHKGPRSGGHAAKGLALSFPPACDA